MCLVHDLAESIVGDITPHCGVPKEEKRNLEEVFMEPYYELALLHKADCHAENFV